MSTDLALLIFLVLIACGLAGCSAGGSAEEKNEGRSEAESQTLTVLAASSLTDAFGELENTFEEQHRAPI